MCAIEGMAVSVHASVWVIVFVLVIDGMRHTPQYGTVA